MARPRREYDEYDEYDDDEYEDDEDDRPRRRRRPPPEDPALKYLIPVNTSVWAVAAGYLGLFAVLCFPAPLALIVSLVALYSTRRHKLNGAGRAWFGLVMGTLFTLLPFALYLIGQLRD